MSGSFPKSLVHSRHPAGYWVLVRVPLPDSVPPGRGALVVRSDSLRGGGLFFDYVPWLAVGGGVVLFSVLFWLPLVRGITHAISQITRASEQIAEGGFEVRVSERRRDELGRLGQALNRMAARLAGLVHGQKRFLGDVAHELCSPLARIQVALGILEQRADGKQQPYVADLQEEVQHMSSLVNELLSFSKASFRASAVQIRPVLVKEIAERAAGRESSETAPIHLEVPGDLRAMAEPELLERSLSNLLRNAVRYAGEAGPITLSARREGERVLITVADGGPGVPEAELARIFDPFYRLDASRNAATGGVGLGLAIVRTCIESCQGTVACRNRQPSGLEVAITLRSAAAAGT
jgi:two-component system sensor histidine kinase CpxA